MDLESSDPPQTVFRMEKRVKELPVREILQSTANGSIFQNTTHTSPGNPAPEHD